MGDIARKVALFNAAYKLAFAHFSEKETVKGFGHRLNLAIRQRIDKGAVDARALADEIIKEIESKR